MNNFIIFINKIIVQAIEPYGKFYFFYFYCKNIFPRIIFIFLRIKNILKTKFYSYILKINIYHFRNQLFFGNIYLKFYSKVIFD